MSARSLSATCNRQTPSDRPLTTRATIGWLRQPESVGLRISRTIGLIHQPPVPLDPEVSFAGYELRTELTVTSPLHHARPAAWTLLQVPPGGRISATVPPGAKPTTCFGQATWTANNRQISSDVSTRSNFKWSLHASECRGRLLHLRRLGDGRSSLLIRQFPLADDSEYSECLAYRPEDTGHACQVYVDDGGLGGFGELEVHAPALRRGLEQRTFTLLTWGFIGSAGAIDRLHEEFTR